jgi:hypothetical protein
VGELREAPDNLKLHDAFNLRSIAASLTEHGQQDLLLVRPDGTMIGGSGRLRAVTAPEYELEWTHVAVLVNTSSDAEARKLGMRLNRTGDLAVWDYERVGPQLAAWRDEGADMLGLGWRDHEVDALGNAEFVPDELQDMPNVDAVGRAIKVNHDQRRVFDAAWALLRELGDDDLTEGMVVERLARDFLDGHAR